jgi:hypothetical protein
MKKWLISLGLLDLLGFSLACQTLLLKFWK